MGSIDETITSRARRNDGVYVSGGTPLPANTVIMARIELDATTMVAGETVKLSFETSDDDGATWALVGSIRAVGGLPPGSTKGDPLHPWVELEVQTGAQSRGRVVSEVAGGPFTFGVRLVAQWP